MSCFVGPEIVNDGLVLCLDAANTKSYSGSGTTWYDLSGNGIHFSMVGSVTFQNGYFSNFTEASNYFQVVDSANVTKLPLGSADRTILSLCRTPTAYHPAYSHVFHYGTDTTDQAFGISVTGSKLGTHPWAGSPVSNEIIPTNTPVFLGVSYTQSSSLHRFFRDDYELTSGNATRAINTGAGAKVARVGSRINAPSELWQTSGRISTIMVYNRVLSAAEIRQVFSAIRGRYEI